MCLIHIFSLSLQQESFILHNSLPAGKQSPLLFLVQPLAAGIGLGLSFSSWFQQWESILLVCLTASMVGTIICHKKIKPFPYTFHNIYIVLLFLSVTQIGIYWGETAMNRLDPLYPDGEYQQLRVVLLEPPTEKPKTYSCLVIPEASNQKLLLYIQKDSLSSHLQPGDQLEIKSRLSIPADLSEEFSYRNYLKTKGITMTGYVNKRHWRPSKENSIPLNLKIQIQAIKIREQLISRIDKVITDHESRAIIHAMLLGDKTDLSTEQKEAYSRTGISHILALSGMHISFIVLLLGWLTCRLPRWVQHIITLTGTWGFIFMVGLPVSAIRAGIMLSILLLNPFKGQRSMAMDRWAMAAIILLILNPIYLLDIGFQLSFAAVAGILLFMPFFKIIPHIPLFIQEGTYISLSAQLAVLPLTLWHFGTFPIYFLLTNLLVCLLFTPLIMYLSIAITIIGEITIISSPLSSILTYIIHLQQAIVDFIQNLPGSQISFQYFNVGSLITGYITIIILLKYLHKKDSKSIIKLQISIICLLLCFLLKC